MTLTEFLRARIAEDEAVADVPDFRANYIGHQTLAERILAECEAKRRIVAHHTPYPDDCDPEPQCAGCSDILPCPTLRYIALPYADHAEYHPEWRP